MNLRINYRSGNKIDFPSYHEIIENVHQKEDEIN